MIQADFKRGQKWRVARDGCSLVGMQPIASYAQQGWSMPTPKGTVLTCDGSSMTFGDGVPAIKWSDAHGKWLANDCEFRPMTGGMWSGAPADGTLQPWSDEAITIGSCNFGLNQRVFMERLAREVFGGEHLETFLQRLTAQEGRWVLWDPEDDENGYLLIGNDPFALAEEAVRHFDMELNPDWSDE